ncbi:MAG: hypothetical protein QM715_14625 [Nibricoccus sp.]
MIPSPSQSASDVPPGAEGLALPKYVNELDLENLKPGSCWRGAYQIGEQLPDVTHGRLFTAKQLGSMQDVILRVFKVRDDIRGRTWGAIRRAQSGDMVEFIEAFEVEGRRIEVMQAAPRLTLREFSTRKKVTPAEVASIVKQLSTTIGNLHKNGIVHFNLRPDAICIRIAEGGMNMVLGGFEMAQLIEEVDGLAEVSVDPFYAPPEAVGLFSFPREPSLRSWDWWSLGRVIQEVVLGQHILGHMLERDVTGENPELRIRAENLLKEENQMVRAGAVEMMTGLDGETNTLLRGLLTGSRDGRWGLAEVQAWLRKEPVKDRYHLARNERLFIWKGRAFTIAEAAEYFASLQHWHEGQENIFEHTNVATLAYFISKEGAHKKTKERFELLLKLIDAPELQHLPPDVAREVLMAVMLKFLAGPQMPLQLRGRKIDQAYLRELLAPDAQPLGLPIVLGFTSHAIVQHVEQLDAETGHMLAEIERIYEASVSLALSNQWLAEDNDLQLAVLILLSMESEVTLNHERVDMRKKYACTRDQVLDRLFKKTDASHPELVVIALTNRDPKKFGYVTHREWNEEQHRILRRRGEQLSAACTWLNLGLALKLGPLIFGRFRFIAPFWLLTAAVLAVVWQNIPGYLMAVGCPVLVIAGRLLCHRVQRERLKNHVEKDRPWTLRSGRQRCRQEIAALLQADTVTDRKSLMNLLKNINEQIGKLDLEPKPEPVARPLHFRGTALTALAGSFLFLAVIGISTRQAILHPPKLPELSWSLVSKYFHLSDKSEKEAEKARPSLQQASAGSLKSMRSALQELRRKKREEGANDVKISWPFKAPAEPLFVTIQETLVSVPEQDAIANEFGVLLLDHYEPATIKDLVAVQVPVEKGVGLMLFNGRTGKLAGRKVYVIGYLPINKSWLDLDSNKAIFLSGQ